MANYNKGIETKQKFILFTHRKLKEQSSAELTVRDLAQECGYSPAALYRHFGSMEDLIAVSSVCFLEKYIADYTNLVDDNDNFLTIYLKGWTLLIIMPLSAPISTMDCSGETITANSPTRSWNTTSYSPSPNQKKHRILFIGCFITAISISVTTRY